MFQGQLVIAILISLISVNSVFGQKKICRVNHPPIDEQSTLVKSQTYNDVYWVSNDSGDDPFIFPLTGQGEIIIPGFLKRHYDGKEGRDYPGIEIKGAVHHDWEAIALLKDTLVIADVGNNGNARRDLGIYLVPEPNPHATYETRPLVWYPVRYEDQQQYPADEWEYDCESVFTFQGKIYFLTKHRSGQRIAKPAPATKLYRMDTRYTNKVNVLKYISRKENLGGWVTDAGMAPDESALVLVAQNPLTTTLWYFPRPKRRDDFLSEPSKHVNLLKVEQVEGICFKDSETIMISNEQRNWFEVPLSAFTR